MEQSMGSNDLDAVSSFEQPDYARELPLRGDGSCSFTGAISQRPICSALQEQCDGTLASVECSIHQNRKALRILRIYGGAKVQQAVDYFYVCPPEAASIKTVVL